MATVSAKKALCWSLYNSGLLHLSESLLEPRGRTNANGCFQILVYHRVADDGDTSGSATTIAGFERQMQCVRRHFHPMSLTSLLSATERREIPSRAIAVTFDDGYEDVFTHALPILRRYEIPATVYLATDYIEQGRPMWNDRLAAAIGTTTRREIGPVLDLGPLPLGTPVERNAALRSILEKTKRRHPAERDAVAAEIERRLEVDPNGAPRMLRWDQVERMHRAGVEFGAHTVHHPILSCVSAEEAWREIAESKRVVESHVQAPVRHFAYPNGTRRDFDDTTRALVERAGFSSAVSTIFGVNTAETDRYCLRRGGPWEEDSAGFGVKLWWYRLSGQREARQANGGR
jgi:peptidoglycan/xylan/chitin deacetylase (PgdA/CDA1 family)